MKLVTYSRPARSRARARGPASWVEAPPMVATGATLPLAPGAYWVMVLAVWLAT